MKIAFVLSHVPNPRMYKRINALKELGDITVICVRRLNQDVYSLINIENVEFRIKELIVPPFSKTMRRMWVNRRIASFITKSALLSYIVLSIFISTRFIQRAWIIFKLYILTPKSIKQRLSMRSLTYERVL